MGKIKQLPLHEAQKIAAGEVVERPANVVKELVENSIDAGAKKISIYIEQGGQSLIRVVDDGSGMSPEDAKICFDHHATSKINSVEDLPHLLSFGFRGEALASISAVSTVTLVTKEPHETHGLKIERSQGTNISIEDIACNHGSDITIKDLFFNVPARKKFLKNTQTEWRQIVQLFHAFCFDYTDIHFLLFSEGKQIYTAPPVANFYERAAQVWDDNATKHVLTADSCNDTVRIKGIITNHQYYRYDRSHIYFFVNKRWIKNQALSRALLKGYLNVIPQGRFPTAVISIEIDPQAIDINIHPRKQEVQFLHPRKVEQEITTIVKKALEQNLSQKIKQPVRFETTVPRHSFSTPPIIEPFKTATFDEQPNNIIMPKPTLEKPPEPVQAVVVTDHEMQTTTSEQPYKLLSQYKKTYILTELEEGLFIIDQHAAHERILYEQFRSRFGSIATVQLLFSQIIALSQIEYDILLPHINLLQEHGIGIESFGHHQIIIQSTPVHLKNISLQELIKELIGLIQEHRHLPKEEFLKILHERVHAQMACKAAVKAGDDLTQEQMQKLLHDLHKTENRFACPHGRPTGWLMSLDELERNFKRKK